MKILSMNVNGVVKNADNIKEAICKDNPDIVCLQNTKARLNPFNPCDKGKAVINYIEVMYGYTAVVNSSWSHGGVIILVKNTLPVIGDITPVTLVDNSVTRLDLCVNYYNLSVYNIALPKGKDVYVGDKLAPLHEVYSNMRRFMSEKYNRVIICGSLDIDVNSNKKDLPSIGMIYKVLDDYPVKAYSYDRKGNCVIADELLNVSVINENLMEVVL